jgi:hypothetical protein
MGAGTFMGGSGLSEFAENDGMADGSGRKREILSIQALPPEQVSERTDIG